MRRSKLKIFLFLCTICFSLFTIVSCKTQDESNDEDNNLIIDNNQGENTESEGENQGSNTGNEEDNQDGDTGTIDNRPKTQKDYIQKYISDDYIKNQNFIDYIFKMSDYEHGGNVVSNALYASPNGTGDGSSKEDATDIQSALDEAKAGQTVYLMGGTYALDESIWVGCSGNENGYIIVRNYPGQKPSLTASSKAISKNKEFPIFALDENVGYLIFEGLEFCNVKTETAIGIAAYDGGQHNIIIRNNKFHNLETNKPNNSNCGANAILLFGEKKTPMNNWLIYGNECYDNVLGWCEAVSVAANCECIYVINNNVHDNTNIGIDFTGNFGYCKDKSLDQPRYCIAAGNVIKNSISNYAECAGLYVDGARDILLVNNYLEGCQYGIEIGSEEKSVGYTVKNVYAYNNIILNNSNCGIRIGGYDKKSSGVVENCVIANNTLVNNGTKGGEAEVVLSMLDGLIFVNNLVKSEKSKMIYTDMTSSETKNVIIKNNCFISKENIEFEYLGTSYSSLDHFNKAFDFSNITGEVELSSTYTVKSGVSIDAGDNSYVKLNYDFNFNERIIDNQVDIGATENE